VAFARHRCLSQSCPGQQGRPGRRRPTENKEGKGDAEATRPKHNPWPKLQPLQPPVELELQPSQRGLESKHRRPPSRQSALFRSTGEPYRAMEGVHQSAPCAPGQREATMTEGRRGQHPPPAGSNPAGPCSGDVRCLRAVSGITDSQAPRPACGFRVYVSEGFRSSRPRGWNRVCLCSRRQEKRRYCEACDCTARQAGSACLSTRALPPRMSARYRRWVLLLLHRF
jgi:hypothetical protein